MRAASTSEPVRRGRRTASQSGVVIGSSTASQSGADVGLGVVVETADPSTANVGSAPPKAVDVGRRASQSGAVVGLGVVVETADVGADAEMHLVPIDVDTDVEMMDFFKVEVG